MDGGGSTVDCGDVPRGPLAEDEDGLGTNLDETHGHAVAERARDCASIAVSHNDQDYAWLRGNRGKRLGRSSVYHARFGAEKIQRLGPQRRLRPGPLVFVDGLPRIAVLRKRRRWPRRRDDGREHEFRT